MRRRFGPISKSRKPKINDFSIDAAVMAFLPNCRSTGRLPSRNQFAKALSVTPKAWRDYVQEHRSADDELIVREWLEAFDKRYPE